MERSQEIKELATALSKAQGAMEAAKKSEENPFFKSRYANLAGVWDVIRKPLSENGLSIVQAPSATGAVVSVISTMFHSSGEWLSEILTMTVKDGSPQSIGSAITYGRRYAIMALVGVAAEDDDGENATEHKEEKGELRAPQALAIAKVNAEPALQFAASPIGHPVPVPQGPYAEIMTTLREKVQSKEGPMIALFSSHENMEWKLKADESRKSPEELQGVQQELEAIAAQRRERIKGGV